MILLGRKEGRSVKESFNFKCLIFKLFINLELYDRNKNFLLLFVFLLEFLDVNWLLIGF